jgi:hypothetical protein
MIPLQQQPDFFFFLVVFSRTTPFSSFFIEAARSGFPLVY